VVSFHDKLELPSQEGTVAVFDRAREQEAEFVLEAGFKRLLAVV